MSIQHVNIADPNIHEPKGVSTAVVDSCYVSDGLGSGSWEVCAGAKYGELIITNGVTTQTLAAASAYATLDPGTEWTTNISSGITMDPTNGKMTVLTAGIYQFNFWINFTTAAIAAGSTYSFKYAINGVVGAPTDVYTKPTNAADKMRGFASALVSLAANDIVEIQVAGDATSSGTTILPTNAAFSVILVRS